MTRLIVRLACAAAAILPMAPASAATLLFTLTGSRSASFQLDSNPVPSSFNTSTLIGNQIFFNNVSGVFNGVAGVASQISFGTGSIAALNVNGTSLGFTQFAGPALFTGAPSAPVFASGVFALTSIVSGSSTLTITPLAAAVPEPSTWAVMTLGFVGIGGVLRYRRRKTAYSLSHSARA